MLSGEDAIWHLLKVGAGLDSLIVGEGQILAQVKRAYEHGIEETGQSGKVVSRMLNSAAAEEIETAPFEIPVSVRTLLPAVTAVLSILETTLPL